MIPSHPAIDRYQTRREAIVWRRDAKCLTRCADSAPGDLSGYGNLAALSLCGWILIGGTAWLFS